MEGNVDMPMDRPTEKSVTQSENPVTHNGDPSESTISFDELGNDYTTRLYPYNWKEFWNGADIIQFTRFLVSGEYDCQQSEGDRCRNLQSLARMLVLLREYYDLYGMPEDGGPADQEFVLREVCKDLYSGGAPIWALETVMAKAAEGLTGKKGVDFFLLPRKAFIFALSSGATSIFRIERGFGIQRLNATEQIVARLASFASNSHSVACIPLPDSLPTRQYLSVAMRRGSIRCLLEPQRAEELAKEVLTLASEAEGLYFYVNSHHQSFAKKDAGDSKVDTEETGASKVLGATGKSALDSFWSVEESSCELFSRLAAKEAMASIEQMDKDRRMLYSKAVSVPFDHSVSICATLLAHSVSHTVVPTDAEYLSHDFVSRGGGYLVQRLLVGFADCRCTCRRCGLDGIVKHSHETGARHH